MQARHPWTFGLFLFFALFLVSGMASAQARPGDKEARALQRKAMDEDYLATDFAKAIDKLTQALGKCGTDRCSPQVRALLLRDLGVVYIGGQVDKNKGVQSFTEALQADPSVQLDPDLKTAELAQAFEQAKKAGASGSTSSGPAPSSDGDFSHTPIPEQTVRTPLPIYAEYAGSETIVKVVARYKGYGMTEWRTLELKRMGKGWGGQAACLDVQQGDFLYYLQGFNEENDPVATAGDRAHPYKVPVKTKISGEPPHLPDSPAPQQCADTGDCPPDFPGCKTSSRPVEESDSAELKATGESCEEDSQCKSNSCEKGECASGEKTSTEKFSRIWVGGWGSFEMSVLPSADDVCLLSTQNRQPVNSGGYYCIRQVADPAGPAGGDYPDRNDNTGAENSRIQRNTLNRVSGGFAPGDIRIGASIEYAFNPNLLVGLRLGFVLGTYPGQAAVNDGRTSPISPVHIEARGSYLFGKDALAKIGIAPYAMAALGYAPFDTKVGGGVTVREQNSQAGAAANKTVDAYNIAGPVFVSVGGGVRYGVTPRVGILGGLRANVAFGNPHPPVPSVGLDVGVHYGF